MKWSFPGVQTQGIQYTSKTLCTVFQDGRGSIDLGNEPLYLCLLRFLSEI